MKRIIHVAVWRWPETNNSLAAHRGGPSVNSSAAAAMPHCWVLFSAAHCCSLRTAHCCSLSAVQCSEHNPQVVLSCNTLICASLDCCSVWPGVMLNIYNTFSNVSQFYNYTWLSCSFKKKENSFRCVRCAACTVDWSRAGHNKQQFISAFSTSIDICWVTLPFSVGT